MGAGQGALSAWPTEGCWEIGVPDRRLEDLGLAGRLESATVSTRDRTYSTAHHHWGIKCQYWV